MRERAAKLYLKPSKCKDNAVTKAIHNSQDDEDDEDSTESEQSARMMLVSRQPMHHVLVQGAASAFIERTASTTDLFWTAFDCLSTLYPANSASECFLSAVEAVSLMNLSVTDTGSNKDITTTAMTSYGRALKAINLALEDPKQRLNDYTFMAIELICLFETISKFEDSVGRAQKHLQGLISMLSARGDYQFNTPTGRRLFLTSFLLWNTGAVAMHKPLPVPALKDIDNTLSVHKTLTFNGHTLSEVKPLIDHGIEGRLFAVLLFASKEATSDIAETWALLKRLNDSSEDFFIWYEDICRTWDSRTESDAIFARHLSRCHGILISDLTMRCYQRLAALDGQDHSEDIARCLSKARELMQEMDVIQPYDLGYEGYRSPSSKGFERPVRIKSTPGNLTGFEETTPLLEVLLSAFCSSTE